MKPNSFWIALLLLLGIIDLEGQIPKFDMSKGSFYQITQSVESNFNNTTQIENDNKLREDLYGRWQWFWRDRVDEHGGFTKYHRIKVEFIQKELNTSSKKSAPSIEWDPLGPTSDPTPNPTFTRLTGVAQATSVWANTSTVYAGIQGGGFWERVDGVWINRTDQYPSFTVYDIAVDNSGKIYIATGYKPQGGTTWVNEGYGFGVFYSTNGGITWETDKMTNVPDEDLFMYRVLIHPTDQNTVYALSRFSVYKTINGGDNWSKLLNVPTLSDYDWYVDIDFDADNPDTIYICSQGYNHEQLNNIISSKLFVSTDGGNSWSQDRGSNVTNNNDNEYCNNTR